MHTIDYLIIIIYLALLLLLGFLKPLRKNSSVADLIIGGRTLTLPAFVASLVSTWYGGILGVGEYSYSHGISNWLVFGLPYYLAAFLFALFLAKRARKSNLMTIPDRLAQTYDRKTAVAGSVIIYLMTVPAAYILMIGTLAQYLFGWDLWVGIIAGTLFSIIYLFAGGFKSVIRTDLFQFALMFIGFIVLVVVLYLKYGGIEFLEQSVPASQFTWNGGKTTGYILGWYVIALATLIEPAFYQRCYAAKTESTARNGIFISILFWVVFDFLTTTSGIYARAIMPDLANPVGSYPALAVKVLPAGLLGLFALSLLATIMSTVDSYSFLAASTFSRDIILPLFKINENKTTFFTRIGLVITAVLAVVPLLFFDSVIQIWYLFGSVGTPALLVPLVSSFTGWRKLSNKGALLSIILSALVSIVWFIGESESGYWLGVQPIFPGLVVSLIIFTLFSKRRINKNLAIYEK